jgi:putative two-component system response regulator
MRERDAARVLVVDDEEMNLEVMEGFLDSLGHECVTAGSAKECFALLDDGIDLLLMDVMMPGMDGFETVRQIRNGAAQADLPIIMVTSLTSMEDRLQAVECGANDFISKPVDKTELKVRLTALLKLKRAQDEVKEHRNLLEVKVLERTAELRQALESAADANQRIYSVHLDTIRRLASAAEYKDSHTAAHLSRVRHYCAIIAGALELPAEEVEIIRHAAPMHDVGKIGIPDDILRKPGKLTQDEWYVMKQHAVMGADMLKGSFSALLQAGEIIARSHHEWWDGSGYPYGLKGEQIPLYGRICAVADVFDALTSRRPYKEAFPNAQAFQIILEKRGTQFDPRLVDLFFQNIDLVVDVQNQYREEEPEGYNDVSHWMKKAA